MAEAPDLSPGQCGFESRRSYVATALGLRAEMRQTGECKRGPGTHRHQLQFHSRGGRVKE